jgi:hypothetical protein
MHAIHVVLAYFSPETVLPVTSILATVLGVILMFGRYTFRLVTKRARAILLREVRDRGERSPHFRVGGRTAKKTRAERK